MIRLVFFDIDGTLIQSGGAGEKAFARVAESEFQVVNGTARLHFAGRTDTAIVREFFGQHQIEPSRRNFQRFFDAYVFWLDHWLDQIQGRVLPGIQRAIRELQSLSPAPLIGLLTGNIRLGAELKLRRYELWEHFQTGAFGDDHEDRNQLALIARERGCRMLKEELRGEQILVIGDTPLDIACARAIEGKALAVSTGTYTLKQLHEHNPTWVVENLEIVSMKELCG
jgi:phosphoglycolate phosphatase-like HAD superfamily hydrolase